MSTVLFGTCSVLVLWIWYLNTRYCAFGFGGFQCIEPFVGRGDWLPLITLILVLAVPLSLANWVWRIVRWWQDA